MTLKIRSCTGVSVLRLYRIVVSRLSGDERTKTYLARRLVEGRTRKEVIRCLKRYVARENYKHLPPNDD